MPLSSSFGSASRIGIMIVLLVSLVQGGVAIDTADDGVSIGVQSQLGPVIDMVNQYFITEEEDRIQNNQELIYQILLPMGLVILLIFVGLETAGFGGGDNIRLALSVVIGLMAIPTGVYSNLGSMFACGGGLCGLGTIIQNFASIAIFLVVGFIIFEIGMKSGSFLGVAVGLVGLIIMFIGIAGLDVGGTNWLALIGGFGSFILLLVFVVMGFFMLKSLTHGH